MSASLVGSEMCIRDRMWGYRHSAGPSSSLRPSFHLATTQIGRREEIGWEKPSSRREARSRATLPK
eukprot:8201343-Alexandrium_andersonii.AAC.1